MSTNHIAEVIESVPAQLDQVSEDELRALRRELSKWESAVSYVRRILQGGVEIVEGELARRGGGAVELSDDAAAPNNHDDGDDQALVALLSDQLGGSAPPGGFPRPPQALQPDDDAALLLKSIQSAMPYDIGEVRTLSDSELSELDDELDDQEVALSKQRRALHEAIDRLGSELASRYRDGLINIDTVIKPG